jgi:hypothetical protein
MWLSSIGGHGLDLFGACSATISGGTFNGADLPFNQYVTAGNGIAFFQESRGTITGGTFNGGDAGGDGLLAAGDAFVQIAGGTFSPGGSDAISAHENAAVLLTGAPTLHGTIALYGASRLVIDGTFTFDGTTLIANFTNDPATLTTTVELFYGDVDVDGDIDNVDIGIATGNFTGAGGSTTMTWADGDMDGDGDVDNVDIGTITGAFTGAISRPLRRSTPLPTPSPNRPPSPSSPSLAWLSCDAKPRADALPLSSIAGRLLVLSLSKCRRPGEPRGSAHPVPHIESKAASCRRTPQRAPSPFSALPPLCGSTTPQYAP